MVGRAETISADEDASVILGTLVSLVFLSLCIGGVSLGYSQGSLGGAIIHSGAGNGRGIVVAVVTTV